MQKMMGHQVINFHVAVIGCIFFQGLLYLFPPFAITSELSRRFSSSLSLIHITNEPIQRRLLQGCEFWLQLFFILSSQFIMVESRATWSRIAEEAETQALSRRGVPPSPTHLPQAQAAQLAQLVQFGGDTVSCLILFLVSLQQTQRQILKLLASQAHRALVPDPPIAAPVNSKPTQGPTPTNTDNLSVARC